MTIHLASQGDENALGFSVTFDPALLTYQSATLGSGAAGAMLIKNEGKVGQGKLGVLLGLAPGQTFAAGSCEILVVQFMAAAGPTTETTQAAFGDDPVVREVSDASANALATAWTPGTITLTDSPTTTTTASTSSTTSTSTTTTTLPPTTTSTTSASTTTTTLPPATTTTTTASTTTTSASTTTTTSSTTTSTTTLPTTTTTLPPTTTSSTSTTTTSTTTTTLPPTSTTTSSTTTSSTTTTATTATTTTTLPVYAVRELPPGAGDPSYYYPSVPLTVTISVNPPPGTQVYAVEDVPPLNWTVGGVGNDGVWDDANRKVKWGPFLDDHARVLTYSVTPPTGEDGTRTFSGTASFNGTDTATGGDTQIENSATVFHPADINCDWRISIGELTAYCDAWKTGTTWQDPPNPIPIAFVTNACLIWKSAEVYHYDPALDVPPYVRPKCWAPGE